MKHVFVETNFLISLLRPIPDQAAVDLFGRNDGVGLKLYLPWCSQAEAKRTLTGIINADLGFTDAMMKFAVRRWLEDRTSFDKREVDKLKTLAEEARAEALTTLDQRIKTTVEKVVRIDPTQDVIEQTLRVFSIKTLEPFDEMVLGAVLARASELYSSGERELFFCELDRDLASQHPQLLQEYSACGLTVQRDFDVK